MEFFIVVTPATGPADSVAPFIIAASSSFFPSLVNTAPFHLLKSELSSRLRTQASTASNAEPPFFKIS